MPFDGVVGALSANGIGIPNTHDRSWPFEVETDVVFRLRIADTLLVKQFHGDEAQIFSVGA